MQFEAACRDHRDPAASNTPAARLKELLAGAVLTPASRRHHRAGVVANHPNRMLYLILALNEVGAKGTVMSMVDKDEPPQDLYVAAYSDSSAAEATWNSLKELADDDVIEVEALALVERDSDGKIHVKDTSHETRTGAKIGAVGGALVGLIFPPSLLATTALGAGLGAGAGTVVDRVRKRKIRTDVEWALPPGSSGVVVVFDEQWVAPVEKALSGADRVVRDHLHGDEEAQMTERSTGVGEPGPHPNYPLTPPTNV